MLPRSIRIRSSTGRAGATWRARVDRLLGDDHIADHRLEVHDLLQGAILVALVGTTTGTPGGEPIENHFVNVVRVGEDDLVRAVDSYAWDQQGIAARLASAAVSSS